MELFQEKGECTIEQIAETGHTGSETSVPSLEIQRLVSTLAVLCLWPKDSTVCGIKDTTDWIPGGGTKLMAKTLFSKDTAAGFLVG